MIKKYRISHPSMDLSVTLQVEHDIIDPFAIEIDNSLGDAAAAGRSNNADGKITTMVIQMAAAYFMREFLSDRGGSVQIMQRIFEQEEDWPDNGIRLMEIAGASPFIDHDDLEVEEVEP